MYPSLLYAVCRATGPCCCSSYAHSSAGIRHRSAPHDSQPAMRPGETPGGRTYSEMNPHPPYMHSRKARVHRHTVAVSARRGWLARLLSPLGTSSRSTRSMHPHPLLLKKPSRHDISLSGGSPVSQPSRMGYSFIQKEALLYAEDRRQEVAFQRLVVPTSEPTRISVPY